MARARRGGNRQPSGVHTGQQPRHAGGAGLGRSEQLGSGQGVGGARSLSRIERIGQRRRPVAGRRGHGLGVQRGALSEHRRWRQRHPIGQVRRRGNAMARALGDVMRFRPAPEPRRRSGRSADRSAGRRDLASRLAVAGFALGRPPGGCVAGHALAGGIRGLAPTGGREARPCRRRPGRRRPLAGYVQQQRQRELCGSAPAVTPLDDVGRVSAQRHYQRFKRDYVSRWQGKAWAINPTEIRGWLGDLEATPVILGWFLIGFGIVLLLRAVVTWRHPGETRDPAPRREITRPGETGRAVLRTMRAVNDVRAAARGPGAYGRRLARRSVFRACGGRVQQHAGGGWADRA